VVAHARGAGELVHDSARHAGREMFGASAHCGERGDVCVETVGECRRHFERRTRRKPAANRHGGRHGAAETLRRQRSLSHRRCDSGHVSSPRGPHRRWLVDGQREAHFSVKSSARQRDLFAAVELDGRLAVDRHGEDEPAGVVGVVADEVHAARRACDVRHGETLPLSHATRRRQQVGNAANRTRIRHVRRQQESGARSHHGFRRADGGVGRRLRADARRPRFFRGAFRQSRRRSLHQARRRQGRREWCGVGGAARTAAAARAVHAERHGARRGRPARSPQHRQGAHSRRVDGRHDRASVRHRAPAAHRVAHLGDVDARRTRNDAVDARGDDRAHVDSAV